jgi:hypothetical protein
MAISDQVLALFKNVPCKNGEVRAPLQTGASPVEQRNSVHVWIDENSDRRQGFHIMGQAERPTCPDCGAPLVLALPPGGKGKRTFQCFDCDRPDPLKTDQVTGWLNSELQPPE